MSRSTSVLRVLAHPLVAVVLVVVAGYSVYARARWSAELAPGAFGAWDVGADVALTPQLFAYGLLPLWLAASVGRAARWRVATWLLRAGSAVRAWGRSVAEGAVALVPVSGAVIGVVALATLGLPVAAVGAPATTAGSLRELGITPLVAVAAQVTLTAMFLVAARALVAAATLVARPVGGVVTAVAVGLWVIVSTAGLIPIGPGSALLARDIRLLVADPVAAVGQIVAAAAVLGVCAALLRRRGGAA